MARAEDVALGVRIKSGWAIAVALAAPGAAPGAIIAARTKSGALATPRLVDRSVLDLSDPEKPELRQPYHAGMGRLQQDTGIIAKRTRSIERTTAQNVRDLLRRLTAGGHMVSRVGLMVGSLIDPETVGSPHIRAHAFEGRLFRSVLERAFQEHSLAPAVFVERLVYADAVVKLQRSEPDIRATLTALGKGGERAHAPDVKSRSASPWRADEKLAALAAWLLLA
jgi:hypothetical protein